jgi:hypothetical protein
MSINKDIQEDGKLIINDLTKLKITKVKGFCIYFEYNGAKYMLHDDSDEDACIGLYIRDYDNPKHVTLINGEITCAHMYSFIKDVSKKKPKTLTYSNIDREYFVKKLVENHLCAGKFEKEYQQYLDKCRDIDEKIIELNNIKAEHAKEWRHTSGHGSKCYEKH